MKTGIFLLLVLLSSGGCVDCNCPAADGKDRTMHDGRTGDGRSFRENDNNDNRGGSGAGHHDNQSGNQTDQPTTGGVGNADAETGTTESGTNGAVRNNNGLTTQPAQSTPKQPGTTGTRHTRAAGTGTQNGRQINGS